MTDCLEGKQIFATSGTAVIARGTSHRMEYCDHEEADLLAKYPAADIWIAFGTGKNFMYIHINDVCNDLGNDKSVALPVFHCFTGCDTTSAFFGKGKKSAWEAWKCYPQVTQAFLYMASHPHIEITVESQPLQLLERFTVILYDKASNHEFVGQSQTAFLRLRILVILTMIG